MDEEIAHLVLPRQGPEDAPGQGPCHLRHRKSSGSVSRTKRRRIDWAQPLREEFTARGFAAMNATPIVQQLRSEGESRRVAKRAAPIRETTLDRATNRESEMGLWRGPLVAASESQTSRGIFLAIGSITSQMSRQVLSITSPTMR